MCPGADRLEATGRNAQVEMSSGSPDPTATFAEAMFEPKRRRHERAGWTARDRRRAAARESGARRVATGTHTRAR
jgi:hypothetical protein